MVATAILDLLRRNPSFGFQTFNSRVLFATKHVGVSTSSAASFAFATPFAFGTLFGNGITQVAFCDAGAVVDEDYISTIRAASGKIFGSDVLKYTPKQYNIEQKPLLSAFHWNTLALTSLRSFMLFYMPLLEPHARLEDEDDDDDFLQENPEERRSDLVVPFKKSIKQIVRETSVVTTRRILERLAVHYVSQRMAWKLLKDVPKSATRKAARGMPTSTYIFCVSRTTVRAKEEESDRIDTAEQIQILGRRVYGATIRCSASLVFASIGAGVGATLVRPLSGQWIGCTIGDLAGPIIVAFCFETIHADPQSGVRMHTHINDAVKFENFEPELTCLEFTGVRGQVILGVSAHLGMVKHWHGQQI